MGDRTGQVAGYLIFLGTAVMGVAEVAWWACAAPVLLLAALRYDAHARFAREHRMRGEERVLAQLLALTLLNSAAFVGGAFLFGCVVGLAFA